MRDDHLLALKDRAAALFSTIPGVTAVGLGGRERNGRLTVTKTVLGPTMLAVPREVAESVAAEPVERLAFTGTGGRVPLGSPWFSDIPPKAPIVARVCSDLAATESGRLLLKVWQTHREERTRLVDRDPGLAPAGRGGPDATAAAVARPAGPHAPGDPVRRAANNRGAAQLLQTESRPR